MLKLREYQKEPINKAIEFFREENPEPVLIVMPTGSGKSIIAAEVAAACPDPILVVQPTKELLEQNLEKYRLLCGDLAPAGIYSASFGKKQIDHVTFATIGSIKGIGSQFRELGFKKMLIDEAHLYPRSEQSMLGEFLRDSGIRQVLGMTATPLKLEAFSEKQGKQFDGWSELIMLTNPCPSGTFFKRILHVSQIQEMTALQYWSPLVYEVLPFDRHPLEMNSKGTEYTEDSVVTAYVANNVRANIVAALDWHSERKHCLVFVPSVEEAEAIASFYPDSAAISGKTPAKERKEIITAFKEGRIRVIFNCLILTTGFDYPEIDMIVTGFSTASMAKLYQTYGRGVRIHPEKKDCLIVDAGGNIERFGYIEDIRFEHDGQRWQMYGTRDKLITGVPINAIGTLDKDDVVRSKMGVYVEPKLTFGKYRGRSFREVPLSYLTWLVTNPGFSQDTVIRANVCRIFLNHIRDTRREPPLVVFPDGKYVGQTMNDAPKDYLWYYYKSKEWNETNDSLRRGVEFALGIGGRCQSAHIPDNPYQKPIHSAGKSAAGIDYLKADNPSSDYFRENR